MGKKNNDNELLAAAAAQASEQFQSDSFNMMSVVSACIVALLPCYVFSQILDLSVGSFWIMYVLLTGASAYALLLSYKATFASAVDRLKIHSKKSTYSFKSVGLSSSEEFNAMVKNNVVEEASAWTFLFCNACYTFTFAFLAFYAFRNVEVAYSYTVSTAAAAAATFYLSTLKNN